MSEQVRVKVTVCTKKIGSECEDEIEFDREDWDSMSEQEREQACFESVWNMAEWNWREIDE